MKYPKETDFFRYTVMTDEGEKLGSFENRESLVEEYGEDLLKICNTVRQKVRTEGKASAVYDDYIVVVLYDNEKFREAQSVYRAEQSRLTNLFYRDCCENVGYDPDSKLAKIVFDKAYDDGHSSGYHAVWNEMEELSDFADDILKSAK